MPMLVLLFFVAMNSAAWAQTPTNSNHGLLSDPEILMSAIDAAERDGMMRVRVRQGSFDSLLNGALIGAGTAVAGGLFLCTRTEPWRNCRDDVGPMLRIGAIGAGIGIAIDALIRDRRDTTVHSSRVHASPIVRRDIKAMRVSVVF